ncbi:hypothetical protein, partial [Bradyrhizobium sp. RT9a]|uniref:hypothetical protein n=1 Tax=Bradyrhizobium sp. RT9a TaxID=3156384 RepID=UPI003394A40E
RSGDKDRSDLLAFLTFDFDLSIPSNPHQFGKASRIILIALVHSDRQSCVRMPSVDADRRKLNPAEFMP